MEFQFGDWLVSPEANIVSNGDAKTQLEPRVMAVLRYLCRHPGAVIPAEEILQACWGSNELGDNPIHKAITQLRRALGDSSTDPRYIETIRKRGYRAIAPVTTLASQAPVTWEGGSPFRGLEAFQENHAAIFFGRVQATAQLREVVMTQATNGSPMALVLGPSGSGKTSLVRAGLLPQLMASATRSDEPVGLASSVYLDCADLGSGTLFQALAGALIDADILGEPLFPGASADSLGQRLASNPEAVAAELLERGCSRTTVGVFVDRIEAVFRSQPGEAHQFLGVIDALAKSNCLLMLMACRNDFYPEVMAQPMLLNLKSRGGHFDVLPPDGADIAQIVRQPALAANLTFEKDELTGASLDDVLCDAARGNPDMLPLLQYTLNELYRQRSEDDALKFEVYHQLGGIEGAVGVRAEQIVANLTPQQIDVLPRVLSLLVNVGEESSTVTSRRSPLSMLQSEDEKEFVRVMIESRLFVSELAGDVPSFGVAHEALLRRWPRVANWIAQFLSSLQLRTQLTSQARRWADGGRATDLLLPSGSQVEKAVRLLSLADFSLAPVETEFIRASMSRAKRGERVRLGITTLIGILALVSAALGLAARNAQRSAEQHRVEAEALLGYMLGEFAEKLRPLGRLDLLDSVSNKALNYLSSTESLVESPTSLNQRAKALHVIAEVNTTRSNFPAAHEALLAARKILRLQDKGTSTDKALLKDLGANAFWISLYHSNRNEWSDALAHANEYLNYSDRIVKAYPNDSEAWMEQSYAYSAIGSTQIQNNQPALAAEAFEKSVQLKRKALLGSPNNSKIKADLANSISWLADAKQKMGHLDAAFSLVREEEELVSSVHQQAPNDGLWTYRLANALWHRATLEIALGLDSDAATHLDKADTLLTLLTTQDLSNLKWKLSLAFVRVNSLIVQPGLPTPMIAKKLDELRKIWDIEFKKSPKNSRLQGFIGTIAIQSATFNAQSGHVSDALATLDDYIALYRTTFESSMNDATIASQLAELVALKGELLKTQNKVDEGTKFCKEAESLLKPFAGDSLNPAILAPYLRSAMCAGEYSTSDIIRSKLKRMAFNNSRYAKYLANR
ncbi:nSTAND1 domain-containing NTPase [Pseudoduganella violaceinigra]|uniref:nSTAND1 domain-containing NTPase n=1 Tax=Pseudoduganella violaceinigra TaxID=246602 RepID=UPI00041F8528|nr:winged helix-turn-helix domain-containing protein [Pseudoduganella violaceinigra]